MIKILPVKQVLQLHALNKGLISELERDEVQRFTREILAFAKQEYESLLDEIQKRQQLTSEIERRLDAVVLAYFAVSFSGGGE